MLASFLKRDLRNLFRKDASPNFQAQNGLLSLRSRWRSVRNVLLADPFSGHLFVFRGKRGDYVKILHWDGSGLCLFAKRLERGRFVWPPVIDDRLRLTFVNGPESLRG